MRTKFLLALLLSLYSAAPLEKKVQKEDADAGHDLHGHDEDNDGLHDHGEAFLSTLEQRVGKDFRNNKFEQGDIDVSGVLTGGDISIGHKIDIDVRGHQHEGHAHGDHSEAHGYLTHGHGDHSQDHGISTEENLEAKIKEIDENIKAIEKLKAAIEQINEEQDLKEKIKYIDNIVKAIEELKASTEHINDQEHLEDNINKIDKNIKELKAAIENINNEMISVSSRKRRSVDFRLKEWIEITKTTCDDLLDVLNTIIKFYKGQLAVLKSTGDGIQLYAQRKEIVTDWVGSVVLDQFKPKLRRLTMDPVKLSDFSVSFEQSGFEPVEFDCGKFSVYSSFSIDGVNSKITTDADGVAVIIETEILNQDAVVAHCTGTLQLSFSWGEGTQKIINVKAGVRRMKISTTAKILIEKGGTPQLTDFEIADFGVSVGVTGRGFSMEEWMRKEVVAAMRSHVNSEVTQLKTPLKEAILAALNKISYNRKSLKSILG